MIRKIVCAILFLSISLCSYNSFADDPEQNGTTLNQIYDPKGKKRIPSRNLIRCEAVNDILFFDANFDYQYILVEIEATGIENSLEELITPSTPYVSVSTLSGECTIRCITDAGAVYEGAITL